MKQNLWLVFMLAWLYSCAQNKSQPIVEASSPESIDVLENKIPKVDTSTLDYTQYEQGLLKQGFEDVGLFYGVNIDLKYTTSDNFTGEVLYDSLQHAFLRPIAAEKLKKALQILQEQHPNYGFLIYDALRPNSVQYKMWDIVKGTEKERYVASPYTGSIHNFGCAVDLTIVDLTTNKPLPMGSDYDYFGPAAEYRYNQQLLNEHVLSQEEVDNRVLFRKVMRQAGFHSIDTEWWHFNALSKTETRKRYKLVK